MRLLVQRLSPFVPWVAAAFFILFSAGAIYKGRLDLLFIALGCATGILLLDLLLFHKRLLVLATVFFVPFSVNTGSEMLGITTAVPSEGLLGILALILGIRVLVKPSIDWKILTHPITILLTLDVLWLLVATTTSTMPFVSIKRLLVRIAFMLIFYLFFAHLFKDKNNIHRIYLCYVAGLFFIILQTLNYHSTFNFSSASSFAIPQPFYNDHTVYGACIAFVLPLLWILVFKAKLFNFTTAQKNLLRISLALFIVAEVLSYSRAAMLSLLVALVFGWLIRFRITLVAIVMSLIVLGASIYTFSDELIESVAQNEAVSNQGDLTSHYQSVTNLQNDASNLERINRWVCAWRMFEEKPITGWGPGTYQFEYGQFQTAEFTTYISTFHGNRGNAHSEYLTYLSETGLPGMILFIVIVFATIGTGLRVIYRATKPVVKQLGIAILLGVTTFFFHGLFNSFIDQDKMAVLAFAAMAALVALDRYHLPKKETK